jgi:integrase
MAHLKPSATNTNVSYIRAMFSFGLQSGMLHINPLANYKRLRYDRRSRVPLTPDEVQMLIDGARSQWHRPFIQFLSETGLRVGEAVKLKWADVDFANRLITVPISKNHKGRSIPLSDRALLAIQTQNMISPDGLIFHDDKGRPINRCSHPPRGLVNRNVGWHDLRRYRASQWIKHGLDIQEVAMLLGHGNIATTQIYLGIPRGVTQRVRNAQSAELQSQNRHEDQEAKHA